MSDNQKLTDVAMPQLAESLVSATIAKWLKKPGDPIEQYEPICEVITDKVNAEIPSTMDGVMGEWLAQEGQTVNVGEVICRIATAAAPERTPSAQPSGYPAQASQAVRFRRKENPCVTGTLLRFKAWRQSTKLI